MVHADIKPENILVDQRYTAKLADFGGSKNLRSVMSLRNGLVYTPPYLSPEARRGEYGKPMDIYAAGLVFWELFNRTILTDDLGNWVSQPTFAGARNGIPRAMEVLSWVCLEEEKVERINSWELLVALKSLNVMLQN